MSARKQLATAIESIIMQEQVDEVEEKTLDDYRNLNSKCDQIISKIEQRRKKKLSPV